MEVKQIQIIAMELVGNHYYLIENKQQSSSRIIESQLFNAYELIAKGHAVLQVLSDDYLETMENKKAIIEWINKI